MTTTRILVIVAVASLVGGCSPSRRREVPPAPRPSEETARVEVLDAPAAAAGRRIALPVPQATGLPTRVLGEGLAAAWLDERRALWWSLPTNHVVVADVAEGRPSRIAAHVGAAIVARGGRWAMTSDGERGDVHVSDTQGRRLFEVAGAAAVRVDGVAFGADDVFVLGGGRLRRVGPTGAIVWERPVVGSSLVASPDGRWLVVRQDDDPVVVLDGADGQRRAVLVGPVCAAAFADDGRTLALAMRVPRGPVVIVDTADWSTRVTLEAQGGCGGLAFSPEGRDLAALDRGVLTIWSTSTWAARAWTLPYGRLAGWQRPGLLVEQAEPQAVTLVTP